VDPKPCPVAQGSQPDSRAAAAPRPGGGERFIGDRVNIHIGHGKTKSLDMIVEKSIAVTRKRWQFIGAVADSSQIVHRAINRFFPMHSQISIQEDFHNADQYLNKS
jgi:hypothetical protein